MQYFRLNSHLITQLSDAAALIWASRASWQIDLRIGPGQRSMPPALSRHPASALLREVWLVSSLEGALCLLSGSSCSTGQWFAYCAVRGSWGRNWRSWSPSPCSDLLWRRRMSCASYDCEVSSLRSPVSRRQEGPRMPSDLAGCSPTGHSHRGEKVWVLDGGWCDVQEWQSADSAATAASWTVSGYCGWSYQADYWTCF